LSSRSKTFAWLQLLRLPNVFTAMADVAMGYLITPADLESTQNFALLVVASSLLYLSGMVLNGVFDAEIDADEWPERPIPSGRVSLTAAAGVGWTLLAGGIAVAWFVSFSVNDWRAGVVATLLAACIILYNIGLKRTRIGPLVMGECRLLNVFLGMSLMIFPWEKPEILIATAIGVYITGVTMFARTDAHISSRNRLTAGMIVLLAGMGMLAAVPWLTGYRPQLAVWPVGWYFLWASIAVIIGRRCVIAVVEPSPARVQAAVRNCVHSIIVLDAAVCVGYSVWHPVSGYLVPVWALAILALLIPTMLLTLWLNST
jgi:4-hydroxybenzoate polyprenyltransferase